MITVFGLGFVGLTTALGFSHFEHKVYGVDVDQERVKCINEGHSPFMEAHFEEEIHRHIGENLKVSSSAEEAVRNSEFIFYCVGTPYGEKGSADLTYLFQALEDTFKYLEKGCKKILIIKSTIPPSTTKEKVIPFIEAHGFQIGRDLYIANNPEFLRESYCWEDFINADRIVIGCEEEAAARRIELLYSDFNIPIHKVSYNTGEFIKYLSNAMLATMISYANEMSIVANSIGDIEVGKAFKILHEDKRWGNGSISSYVYPGCGYGGYCLPKDTNALWALAKEKGYTPKILENVIDVNDRMPEVISEQIKGRIGRKEKIGILGLSFKPNSDDVRDCISAKVIKRLLDSEYNNILCYDPVANELFKERYNYPISYMDSLEKTIIESDVLVILTAWSEFTQVSNIKDKLVLDFRYMIND